MFSFFSFQKSHYIAVVFAWKMFRWMDAAKEKHTRNVYMHLVWALQIATGGYKNIDLVVESKLHILAENTEAKI